MRVSKEELKKSVVEILMHFGETQKNAEDTANCFVKADMRGVSTHGSYLLKPVELRVKANQMPMPTVPEVIEDKGATLLIDGKDGLGPVAGTFAIERAMENAKKYGIGISLIRNTTNVGSLAYYTSIAADNKMIGWMATNAAASMSPFGGAQPFLGTNPIAISIPTSAGTCFTADLATSVVARGKIRKASRNHTPIPEGWALDKSGNPTTDPDEALKGTLLPMGGPQGSALALMVDIIAGVLAGSAYGPNLKSFHTPDGPTGVGAYCIVIDIEHFMDYDNFIKLMDEYVDSIKHLDKAAGFTEILMPGEIEYRKEQESLKNGIELDEKTVTTINELLQEAGSQTRLGGAMKQ